MFGSIASTTPSSSEDSPPFRSGCPNTCSGIRLQPRGSRIAGGVLLASRGCLARVWRLALRPVRRAQRDLVGPVGGLGGFVSPVLSANRSHHSHGPRAG